MSERLEASNKGLLERLNNVSKIFNLGAAAVGAVLGLPALVTLGVGGYIVDKTIGDPIAKKLSGKQSKSVTY
jgi:hypothetical protein